MKEIRLDGRKMDTRDQAFAYLRRELRLPGHFGNNLDALADCLAGMRGVAVRLTHQGALRNALGDYGVRLVRVFQDAAQGRTDFRFRVEGD